MKRFSVVPGLLLLLASSGAASPRAADVELTVTGGLRTGGTVDGDATGELVGIDLDESLSYGLVLDIRLGQDTWATVLWSAQQTDFDGFGLGIDYFQAGGVYRPERDANGKPKRIQPFVAMTVGLTWFDPAPASFDSDVGLSLTLDAGARIPLNERVAVRLEGRALLTLTDAVFSGICGPGACTFRLTGDGLFQLELLVGLTFRF